MYYIQKTYTSIKINNKITKMSITAEKAEIFAEFEYLSPKCKVINIRDIVNK